MTTFGFDDPDPSPPMRLGEILAETGLSTRFGVRVDAGLDEEGNVVLLCTCGCGALTEAPLWPVIALPGEVAWTCVACTATHWLAVS